MSQLDPSLLDAFFRCLADSRRRFVLANLLDHSGGSATVDELTDGLVEVETYSPPPDRQSIETALVHHHLPMLAEKGHVVYDRDRGVVTTTPRTEQIVPYMTAVRSVLSNDL